MAILKIARMGHPILLSRAQPVPDPTAPDVRRLAEDMIDTLLDAEAAGLAAPQVHVPLRLVVFRCRTDRSTGHPDDDPTPRDIQVVINPELEPIGSETETAWEGCLSIPGLRGAVPRYARIRYRGLDLEGNSIDRVAGGFHARVVQHEVDHLDGILYPMRMTDLALFGFTEELCRAAQATIEASRER
ncbi:MAG: peptide deformylase [Acetobacteraceae bacterium]|nr:peptide deformylase [Acetobacteraceae bacterium]